MSKVATRRCVAFLAILILAVVVLPAAAGQAQHSAGSAAQSRLARAAEVTVREGLRATLPPHLSTLLGLSNEEEFPVLQGVVRTGTLVQGFDVSVANKNDIVLFVVDEAASNQALFLTSPEGVLRKVVSVKAGVGDVVRITDKEKEAFKEEKQFWVDRLVPLAQK